jgi:hypothetical protein
MQNTLRMIIINGLACLYNACFLKIWTASFPSLQNGLVRIEFLGVLHI